MTQSGPDIDLHPYFRDPDKARAILDAATADNISKNRTQFRVIHGKGKGHFRNMIQSHLDKHPDVVGFILCDSAHGGSGASWVHLKSSETPVPDKTNARRIPGVLIFQLAVIFVIFIVFHDPIVRICAVLGAFWLLGREFLFDSEPDS